jgi:hypothetical protein
MWSKAQIIWTLIGAATGTTAYQAYEHRQELIDAAGEELTIAVSDSLENLAPPDSSLAPPDWNAEEGKSLAQTVSGYLDSARGALQASHAKTCEGYCDVRRDKCVRIANRESDLVRICEDEHAICFKGCHADEAPAAETYKMERD